MSERLTSSLQESVLTLIATNDEQGRIASVILKPEFFDDNYRDIATRILSYQRKNRKAPGKAHLDDLLDDVLSNPKHKKRTQYLHVLEGIFAQASSLNAQYVFSRVSEFARLQSLKKAWFDAADILQAGNDGAVEEVEQLWFSALKAREQGLDAGVFLSDRERALSFLEKTNNSYRLGIPALDRVGCGPEPGKILLFIAPKGFGKSWFGIHGGRQCLFQRAKVVHITLEMPLDEVIQRYYQNLFAITKRNEAYNVTRFELDDLKRLATLENQKLRPKISLNDKNIRSFLNERIKDWGAQFDRLVVQEFPSGTLSVDKLDAYLDYLELSRKFIPNVMVLDYPDLMQIKNSDNLRIEIGRIFVNLRGLLKKRNIAGIFMTQGNRESLDATTVKSKMVSEDISKLFTSDKIVIYSQTEEEEARGLARLRVNNNRGDEDGFNVLISQSYKSGQFVLDSVRMHSQKHYFELLGPKKKKTDEEE